MVGRRRTRNRMEIEDTSELGTRLETSRMKSNRADIQAMHASKPPPSQPRQQQQQRRGRRRRQNAVKFRVKDWLLKVRVRVTIRVLIQMEIGQKTCIISIISDSVKRLTKLSISIGTL